MPHNYLALSPADFETLAADILSAAHNVHFERYGEGPDGGIDCKHVATEGEVWVGQAKRYKDVNALLRLMPKEQQKMLDQSPQRANGRLKLLFTTRNYILKQAFVQIDAGQSLISELCQRAVYIEHNNATFRVELVYSAAARSKFRC